MKFLELTWRIYVEHWFYRKMTYYHFNRAERYIEADSKDRFKHHTLKQLHWANKWFKSQERIEELKTYFTEKYEGLG